MYLYATKYISVIAILLLYKFHFKEREEIIVALKEENERLLSKARCVEGDEANDEEYSPDNTEFK